MSAEILRRAASLMRERAEAAEQPTGGDRWIIDRLDHYAAPNEVYTGPLGAESGDVATATDAATAEHIASWHPAVALAVAKLLDRTADDHDQWWGVRAACRDLDMAGEETDEGIVCDCSYKDCYEHGKWHNCTHGQPDLTSALTVARAYLGESS